MQLLILFMANNICICSCYNNSVYLQKKDGLDIIERLRGS